jgi:hypothetical protein
MFCFVFRCEGRVACGLLKKSSLTGIFIAVMASAAGGKLLAARREHRAPAIVVLARFYRLRNPHFLPRQCRSFSTATATTTAWLSGLAERLVCAPPLGLALPPAIPVTNNHAYMRMCGRKRSHAKWSIATGV